MRISLLIIILASLAASSAAAQTGAVIGRAVDAESGEPVPFTQILVEEAQRSDVADEEGFFEITLLRPGAYTLKSFRIGYEQMSRQISVPADDTLRLVLRLSNTSTTLGEIVVRGERDAGGQLAEADESLEGRLLRRRLGTTIAETLDDQPGLSMRSMGPARARPVLRGLGGARLLMLEDGMRTGDLSATSSDHAVAIEPLTAERIEVLRGPAVLLYGSNALAGVVNVERGYVPTSRPDGLHAELTTQAQSVNRGVALGASLQAPAGPLAMQADGSLRRAQNLHTPAGVLENTELTTYNGSLGMSRVTDWGYAGLAGSYYQSDYGIPGGFVGAHPDGVSITLERYHLEARGAFRPRASHIRRVEAEGAFNRYHHKEFEAAGILGIEFGVLSWNGKLTAYTQNLGPFSRGAFGVWGEYRDYASGGLSFTPRSNEIGAAGFAYQETRFNPFTLKAGLRYDLRLVIPEEETETDIGFIRKRTFGGVSASLAGSWRASSAFNAGLRLMHSLRMPGITELYSQGPHLAAYTFQVGNPDLRVEKGWGVEVFSDVQNGALAASLALFYNYFTDYIFPRPTGETSRVLLPIYRYSGARARMAGGEATAGWQLSDGFSLNGALSYVRGALLDTGTPLPAMPPLQGTLGLTYERKALTLSATARAAAPQNRVYTFPQTGAPGRAEAPTAGYVLLDVSAQYHITAAGLLHTFTFGIENALNTEYRDHLSRVRVIMPEPGRNAGLLYRVYF